MNIALVILHADPARGGAERYTLDLAAALTGVGHNVTLVAATFAPNIEGQPSRVRKQALPSHGFTRAQKYARFLKSLDSFVDDERFDIVHAMLPVHRCDVYHPHAGVAAGMTRPADVLLRRRRLRFAEVERALLNRDDGPVVLCLSDYVKSVVRKHYALPDERLATLFNAVDLDRFQPSPTARPPRDYVNGLFIGQDFERKGLTPTLVAASMLKDPRLKITVVGKRNPGFHWPDDGSAQVSFAGEVKDPRPFYRDADFFVLPTKHDPCSLVVLEALAMGLPVISTRFNGACEIMTDGVHGFVLDDPNDVSALASAMRKLLDPELRARMSNACIALRPALSYEQHLRTLTTVYERVRHHRPSNAG